jgi:thiopeptide-type bacteriocin biosynthesis protein
MRPMKPTPALTPAPNGPLAITPSGFFAFRTPLLPFDVLEAWGAGLEAATAAAPDRASALARDRALLRARLRALVTEPVIREALFVASPSLDDAIDAWLKDPASERARGVVEILVRYLARMCARATPFGLFSGCAVAPLGRETRLVLAPRAAYQRHTRLDTHYLSALCEELQKDASIRTGARFAPSSGLFPSAGQLRYAEGRIDPVTRERSFHLVSVELSDYLAATMERARGGATRDSLARALVEADAEVALEEAEGFVDQLIDSQILVSDLAPPVTGKEPIHDIATTLRESAATGAIDAAACITAVSDELDAMDAAGLGLHADRYRAIAGTLAGLPAKTELPRLFQVDLFKPAPGATLGGAPLREIQQTVARLARMRRPEGRGEALRRFREAFIERYESREVPLVDALDDERGIGFESPTAGSSEPSPLLDDLHFPGDAAARGAWGAHDEWLLRALARQNDAARAAGRGLAREWVLDDDEMKALEDKTPASLPDAFAVMASLAAPSPEALAKGDFTLCMHGISGPSGAILLGRFCHGDEELRAHVEQHLRAEEALRPDAIFAEVVHLPEGRLGNILCRPTLRAHEIPYLGRSGAPPERQIAITDLRVSLRGDRIVLRSERLGKEVLPRLTSAHNHPMAALGTYRFLCALQSQDGDAGLGWSWGALSGAPFLPRVRHGRVILAVARWVVEKEALAALAKGDDAARFDAVQALRARLELPRWVGVADADNVLPVDLDNVLSVESFVALVKNRRGVALQEMHPLPDELCATGPEGRFVHEVVVPFVRTRTPDAATAVTAVTRATSAPSRAARRTFAPGSEWLYAKLYTGTATADRVLGELVAPLVAESLAEGDADRWFFLRYSDPRWHLRVRLHGDPARLMSRVLPRLHALAEPWLKDQRISRIQLDTYEREVERYGGDRAIDLCERIFAADSDATLAILASLSGDAAADARWRLALRGMHLLLDDLQLDLGTRHALLASTRASFAAEHRADGALEKQLGAKFRKERASIDWVLRAPVDPGDLEVTSLHPGFAALADRSQRIAAPARGLAELEAADPGGGLRVDLAGSLLHMHANRLLRSEQRAQELVLYDFLARIYDSEVARGRPARVEG